MGCIEILTCVGSGRESSYPSTSPTPVSNGLSYAGKSFQSAHLRNISLHRVSINVRPSFSSSLAGLNQVGALWKCSLALSTITQA